MRTYGYARISTKQQNIERQVRNIKAAYPDAIIIKEAATGTKLEGRQELDRLLSAVRCDDTIVFDSVSRMSRNAAEGFSLYKDLMEKGIHLVFIREPYVNTSTYQEAAANHISVNVSTGDDATDDLVTDMTTAVNKYMLRLAEKQIQLAFAQAEKEVKDLHQRTKEGIETARMHGKQIGQQAGKKLTIKKKSPAMDTIRKHSRDFDGTLTDTECIKLTGLSRNTFYKYKAEMKQAAEG